MNVNYDKWLEELPGKCEQEALDNLEDFPKYQNASVFEQVEMFTAEVKRLVYWYIDEAEDRETKRQAAREGIEI